MLRLECPECKEWIHSPVLTEIKELRCPVCAVIVPVKDLYITAGPFSIYREVLLKNRFKYQRLLAEAEKELEEIKKGGSIRPHSISASSIELFMENIKEMLGGCRDNLRMEDGAAVRCFFKGEPFEAMLVNISSTGACIDTGSLALKKDDEVTIELGGTPGVGVFSVMGSAAWASGKKAGIKFYRMEERVRTSLIDYIKERYAAPD